MLCGPFCHLRHWHISTYPRGLSFLGAPTSPISFNTHRMSSPRSLSSLICSLKVLSLSLSCFYYLIFFDFSEFLSHIFCSHFHFHSSVHLCVGVVVTDHIWDAIDRDVEFHFFFFSILLIQPFKGCVSSPKKRDDFPKYHWNREKRKFTSLARTHSFPFLEYFNSSLTPFLQEDVLILYIRPYCPKGEVSFSFLLSLFCSHFLPFSPGLSSHLSPRRHFLIHWPTRIDGYRKRVVSLSSFPFLFFHTHRLSFPF